MPYNLLDTFRNALQRLERYSQRCLRSATPIGPRSASYGRARTPGHTRWHARQILVDACSTQYTLGRLRAADLRYTALRSSRMPAQRRAPKRAQHAARARSNTAPAIGRSNVRCSSAVESGAWRLRNLFRLHQRRIRFGSGALRSKKNTAPSVPRQRSVRI